MVSLAAARPRDIVRRREVRVINHIRVVRLHPFHDALLICASAISSAHRCSDYPTILSKIILAKPTLSDMTDVIRGDDLLMSRSRASRTAALILLARHQLEVPTLSD